MKKLILFMVIIPFLVFANYTGERILKASQKYGMTDSELEYLIDNTSPDLTLKDPQFQASALIHASVNNRPNMVRMLLEKGGVDVDDFDINGETALIGAARKGNVEVVKILLDFGANREIVGTYNKTAYDYAVQFQHTEVARLLGGPPKNKISFRNLAKTAVAMGRKSSGSGSGATSLMGQKYFEDLGKISLIVENMKPGSGNIGTGKSNVEKIEEIGKITGFSDVVEMKIKAREQEEQKLKLEEERKKKEEHSKMMAKLKAISAFNNLYLDVSGKSKTDNWAKRGAAGKKGSSRTEVKDVDVSKLSFSDATLTLMNQMDSKLEEKEKEMEREKQLDLERGALERAAAIKEIIFAGSRNKNISSLKNEPPEKLKEKIEAIQSLLDAKESREARRVSLQMAAKKIGILKKLEPTPKAYSTKIDFLMLEERYLKNKAEAEAKRNEERKRAELARLEKMERDNFYKVVQEKARATKFAENLKGRTAQSRKVAEDKTATLDQQSGKQPFDEVKGALMTPDFNLWFLTNRDCEIRRNPSGGFLLFIKKLKFTNVKATSRREAKWFVNMREKPTPPHGGKPCRQIICKDPAIYVSENITSRELFLSNLFIQLGPTIQDHFEVYSSVDGNRVIKVPTGECRKNFR